MTREEVIERAARAAIQCRDFCGHEPDAILDSFLEDGCGGTDDMMRAAMMRANELWQDEQRRAGARVLSGADRAAAYRSL